MAKIHRYFRILSDQGASDLHLAAGRTPLIRVHGEVTPISGEPVLDDATLSAMMQELAAPHHWEEFVENNDLDFATALEGVGRFRANYFRQEHGVGCVFRMIPDTVISFEDLKLPEVIGAFSDFESGLVLVTGPTGSGKSTTLAAIIDLINRRQDKHIVTVEDPIEFVHQNKRSIVSQREVGANTKTFGSALRSALRQDANVVLVGEMRDIETISLAITAASMGILVFGTLHTSGAAKTIDRIIDAFPAEEQPQARSTLAECLGGVVSQLLLQKVGGGRIAVHEILLRTTSLPGIVREGKITLLYQLIASSRKMGMKTMDDDLQEKLQSGLITAEEAYMKSHDKGRFRSLVESQEGAEI